MVLCQTLLSEIIANHIFQVLLPCRPCQLFVCQYSSDLISNDIFTHKNLKHIEKSSSFADRPTNVLVGSSLVVVDQPRIRIAAVWILTQWQ